MLFWRLKWYGYHFTKISCLFCINGSSDSPLNMEPIYILVKQLGNLSYPWSISIPWFILLLWVFQRTPQSFVPLCLDIFLIESIFPSHLSCHYMFKGNIYQESTFAVITPSIVSVIFVIVSHFHHYTIVSIHINLIYRVTSLSYVGFMSLMWPYIMALL